MDPVRTAPLTDKEYQTLYQENRGTPIGSLPLDVFRIILEMLEPKDMVAARAACKYFKEITDTKALLLSALAQSLALSKLDLPPDMKISPEAAQDLFSISERLKFEKWISVSKNPPKIEIKDVDSKSFIREVTQIIKDLGRAVREHDLPDHGFLEDFNNQLNNFLVLAKRDPSQANVRSLLISLALPHVLPKDGFVKQEDRYYSRESFRKQPDELKPLPSFLVSGDHPPSINQIWFSKKDMKDKKLAKQITSKIEYKIGFPAKEKIL